MPVLNLLSVRWTGARLALIVSVLVSGSRIASAAAGRYELKNPFGMSVTFSSESGRYAVLCDGRRWFGEGLVSVLRNKKWFRSSRFPVDDDTRDPRLILQEVQEGSGADSIGTFTALILRWRVPEGGERIETGFRLYQDHPFLIFVSNFPDGFENYANGDWTQPSVAFPQFAPYVNERLDLHQWVSGGMFTDRFGYGDATALGGTDDILVLLDDKYKTAILSPFNNFLVATQQSTPIVTRSMVANRTLNCGIEGLVKRIPAGFKQENILVFDEGVHATFYEWGRTLLRQSGKAVPSKYFDASMRYPVYFDDAGAYYYQHGFKDPRFSSYEDIIVALDKEAEDNKVEIGAYHIFDDDAQQAGTTGTYLPKTGLFPHGLDGLRQRLNKPLLFYFRWFRSGGPYREEFPYWYDQTGTPPLTSLGDVFYTRAFWDKLARQLSAWGGISLQHDFLSTYEGDRR